MIPSRHPNLVLIQHTVKSGEFGDQFSWVEFRQVWVSINPNRGREVFAGEELQATVSHTIRGDFLELEGVVEKMRVIYNDTHQYGPSPAVIRPDSEVFDILAVMPNYDGRDDVMMQANLITRRFADLPTDIPA